MLKFIINFIKDPKLYQYLVVGGFSAIVDISLFLLIRQFSSLHYLLIATITFLVATLVNYLLCSFLVFKHATKNSASNRFLLTYLVSSIGLIIHHATLFLTFEVLILPLVLSKIIAMGIAFGWNFLSRKKWVFKSHSPATL